ncbi:hypothetical protein EJB05_26360, partial [Eragrostis curvula]
MCRKKSVSYFAYDPAHRLFPASSDGDGDDEGAGGGKFTCDGCLVAGAGRRYRCSHPGCGFTIHEACARGFPRKLKSAVHPRHKLRRRVGAADDGVHGVCEVCGEDVKGVCYGCAACWVAVHPLCARMPGTARCAAHAGGGHEAWLVRVAAAASSSAALAPEDDGDGEKEEVQAAAAAAALRGVRAPRRRRVAVWRSPLRGAAAVDYCTT